MADYDDVDIIIPYRPSDKYRERNCQFIIHHLTNILPGATVVTPDDPDPKSFNRGRAVNAGASQTSRRVLVVADGDVWLPPPAIWNAVDKIRSGVGSYVIPFRRIIWVREAWTTDILEGRRHVSRRPDQKQIQLEWGQVSTGITNVVSRDRFEFFGGFDPRFRGWGFEDCAWEIIASTLGGRHVRLQYEGRHLFHPPCASKEDANQISIGQALHQRYAAAKGDRAECLKLVEEIKRARAEEGI